MKKLLLLFMVLILNVNLCFADNEICFDNICYQEIYSCPQLGFYAFLGKENKTNNVTNSYYIEAPVAKLARLYSFDSNYQGKFIIVYTKMPNINAFKNAPKTNLGSLEKVARSQGSAIGHLSVNLPENGYIIHTTFFVSNGQIIPVRKYKEWTGG